MSFTFDKRESISSLRSCERCSHASVHFKLVCSKMHHKDIYMANMVSEEFLKLNVLYKETNDILDVGGAVDTFGALWPSGTCGPLRDFIAKRIICLFTKMNSSTNTCRVTDGSFNTLHTRYRSDTACFVLAGIISRQRLKS